MVKARAVASVCDCSTCLSGSLELWMKVSYVSHIAAVLRHFAVPPGPLLSSTSDYNSCKIDFSIVASKVQ
jgi:hypothetical protein